MNESWAKFIAVRIGRAQERYDEDAYLARILGLRPRRRTLAELYWGVRKP